MFFTTCGVLVAADGPGALLLQESQGLLYAP